MEQLISSRYAKALFDLAVESNKINEFENQVHNLYEILNSEKDFMQILQHPQIVADEKIELLKKVFESKVSDEIMGLLVLIIRKNREEYILDILNSFLNRIKEYKGIVTATVITAVALSNEQINLIKAKLTNSLKKQVQIETQIDQSIIGGLIIRVGDSILDASIGGKLQSLKASLYDSQLV
ncbi:MAG TPA: F0F1 ATP synthase subunit delta [Defluviitaleaceae bacterium]|jgi:F-type H+-transporting ATPase subunit delta|nr:F0F1 ATP synthase subunit delta [Candidatus Epulonipiscium sp.]HOA81343.1 F0F1 ATP synthase subunit delta [Defluviitaleaceae bacterium]